MAKKKKITLLSTKLKSQFRIKPSEPRTGLGGREDDWKGQRGAAWVEDQPHRACSAQLNLPRMMRAVGAWQGILNVHVQGWQSAVLFCDGVAEAHVSPSHPGGTSGKKWCLCSGYSDLWCREDEEWGAELNTIAGPRPKLGSISVKPENRLRWKANDNATLISHCLKRYIFVWFRLKDMDTIEGKWKQSLAETSCAFLYINFYTFN